MLYEATEVLSYFRTSGKSLRMIFVYPSYISTSTWIQKLSRHELWSRGGARGARYWSAEGATGGEHASAGGACSLADGGVAGVRAERATGAPKARRAERASAQAERASAQAEHAGTRWSHRRSADNFTVQRSAPTGHLVYTTKTNLNG